MALHCALVRNGLLNRSEPLPISADDCRLAVLGSALYCFYRVGTRVFYISRTLDGAWSIAEDVGIESLTGLPAVFLFNGLLHVYGSGEAGDGSVYPGTHAKMAVFDPLTRNFRVADATSVFGSPAVLTHRGRLHRASRFGASSQLMMDFSDDGRVFYAGSWVRMGGNDTPVCKTDGDPVLCVYQGLIHLFFQGVDGLYLIKCDGEAQWGRAQRFIARRYAQVPALAVHDGMLVLAFANAAPDPQNTISVTPPPTEQSMGDREAGTLDLYRYDGNAVGRVERSININAAGAPQAAVLDGVLHLVFACA